MIALYALVICGLLGFVQQVTAIPDSYVKQSGVTLIPNISTLEFSHDRKYLVALQSDTKQRFYFYDAIKMILKQTITIDDPQRQSTPNCVSFNFLSGYLAIGTKEGAVYSFRIQNQLIITPFQYKYYTNQTKLQIIRQVQFSQLNLSQLAIVVNNDDSYDRVQIIGINQYDTLQCLYLYVTDQQIASVSWSPNNRYVVSVGSLSVSQKGASSLMVLLNFNSTYLATISKNSTSYVKYSDSGKYLLQCSPDIDINIYDGNNYSLITSIPDSKAATFVEIVQIGQDVIIGFSIPSSNSIKIKQMILTENKQFLNTNIEFKDILSSQGKQFCLSNNGDQVLIVDNNLSFNIEKWGLCQQHQIFMNNKCQFCDISCLNGCFGSPNTCICKQNEYFSNNKCNLCESVLKGCTSCSNSGSSCYKCNQKQFWHLSLLKVGQCDCSMDVDHRLPDNQNFSCICSQGYYDTKTSEICQDCILVSPGCKQCQDKDNCVKCAQSFELSNITNKCICPQGKSLNLDKSSCMDCYKLNKYCLQCQTHIQQQKIYCTKCAPTFSINPIDNATCICPTGSILNEQSLICEPFTTKWPLIVGLCIGGLIVIIVVGFVIKKYLISRRRRGQSLLESQQDRMNQYIQQS